MKIFYCAFVRLPTEKAHGAQIVKTCEAFVQEGAEVSLVVPNRKTHINDGVFSYYGAEENFFLQKLTVPDLVSWGPIGFLFSMLWFSEAARVQKAFWNADVVYSRDAFVLLQYILLRRKLVYEAHTRPSWVSVLVAKRAHKVVVISEGLRDAYIERGVKEEDLVVAHDAIDKEAFEEVFSKDEVRDELDIPKNKKVALYVGKIDEPKGARTFAATSEYVPDDVLCVLIGPENLEKAVWKKQYPKSLFLPETPYRDLPRVLAAGDILVLPNSGKDKDASKYTSPLKAFAYLAVGKPIVASDVPALRDVLGRFGVRVAPDDPVALAQGIAKALDLETGHSRMYSWNDRASRILKNI